MKKQFHHTKGEWILKPEPVSEEWRIWDDSEGLAQKVIAFIPMRHRGKKQSIANAKLVASAPELLDTLQIISELLSTKLLDSEDRVYIVNALKKKIDLAIQKATA